MSSQKGKFTVMSLNCQSINSKFNELSILVKDLKDVNFEFSAICLQESWLGENVDVSVFHIENYHCISKPKSCSSHGGLIIYLHQMYDYDVSSVNLENSDVWEGLFIRIKDPITSKNIELGNIYRPPKDSNSNENVNLFITEISPILSKLNKSKALTILAGDFNLDLLKVNHKPVINEYLETLLSHSFNPKIIHPTRLAHNSATLIDNIFSNEPGTMPVSSGILISNISDHFPCFSCFGNTIPYNPPKKVVHYRKVTQQSITNLYEHIENLNLSDKLHLLSATDANLLYNVFETEITKAIDRYIPLCKKRYNKYKHKQTNWITTGILKSIKFRDNLYKKYKKALLGSPDFFAKKQNLKAYNAILKKLITQAKTDYYGNQLLKNKSDTKQTWKIINDVIHKNRNKTLPDYFMDGDIKLTEPKDIAERFNKYFGSIGEAMAQTISYNGQMKPDSYLNANHKNVFNFHPIDTNDTTDIIKKLKTKQSTGYDGLSTSLLKRLLPVLVEPLTYIINSSLQTGIFPDKLKTAKIIPIHKKDCKHKIENYRPISLLPSISKVFEKVAYEQLSTYLILNEFLYENQYGFRSHHSTEHAVLELVDRVTMALDKGHTPLALFLDLSKAFDTLDHTILIQKLQFYGLKDTSLQWFQSYLQNRSHYVELDATVKSKNIPLVTGVPQGSILGPLLFIIYVNDIQFSSKYFNFIIYADDTTLAKPLVNFNLEINANEINTELKKILEWLSVNKLSLNIKKTKYIIFHGIRRTLPDNITPLKINGSDIKRVTDFDFLGVILNEHLTWNNHLEKISKNVSRGLGIINKLRHYFPLYVLKILYFSLIQSHMINGILTWGFNTTKIFKLQKRAVRLITNNSYLSHSEPLFKSLNILKIDDLFYLTILKFYYNLKTHCLPHFFHSFDTSKRSNLHNYNTRNKNLLNTVKTRLKSTDNCLRVVLPKVVNSTNSLILDKVFTHSLSGFTTYIKQYLIEKYLMDCNIDNCYVCGLTN
jgi:hypothetical protein